MYNPECISCLHHFCVFFIFLHRSRCVSNEQMQNSVVSLTITCKWVIVLIKFKICSHPWMFSRALQCVCRSRSESGDTHSQLKNGSYHPELQTGMEDMHTRMKTCFWSRTSSAERNTAVSDLEMSECEFHFFVSEMNVLYCSLIMFLVCIFRGFVFILNYI